MLSAQKQVVNRPANFFQVLQVECIAGFFFLLGLVSLLFPFYRVFSQPELFQGESGDILWNILQTTGFIQPFLFVGAAFLVFRLAWRLHQRELGGARWARSVLLWLMVLGGMAIVQSLTSAIPTAPADVDPLVYGFQKTLPWIFVELLIVVTLLIVTRSMSLFSGDEDTSQLDARKAWNLLAPALIVFLLIAISPLEKVFLTSLTNERFASSEAIEFVGLSNYTELLGFRLDTLPCLTNDDGSCQTEVDRDGITQTLYPRPRDYLDESYTEMRYRGVREFDLFGRHWVVSAIDDDFFNAAVTSVGYTIFAIFFQFSLGLFIAMILSARLRGGGFLRLALLIPMAIPTLIATQFWTVILAEGRQGIANSFLMGLGVIHEPQAWLLDKQWQIPAAILVIVWKETPTMALLLLPGLMSISKEVYQAAGIDGANRIQQFFQITLPIMRPTIGVALILRTMVTLRVFDVFDILLRGDPDSMATYAYDVLTVEQKLGYSSAISVTIFAIILVFTIIYMRTMRLDD